jgi:hypothetical protein
MAENLKAIENLMDSYDSQRNRRKETSRLVNKWEPTGLLEGFDEDNKTHGMAVLLENQARQLIDESSRTGQSEGSEEWSGVALPLVRRIFGELAAQDFVSVQPMNLPSGLIFYLDYKYGSAQAGHTSGGDVFGNTSGSNVDASGGLYGAGRHGYTINDDIATPSSSFASASWADVDFEPDLKATGSLLKITIPQSELSGSDPEGVRAFEISGSGTSAVTNYYPAYSKADGSNFTFIASVPGAGEDFSVKYHKAPTDITRGDFEAGATHDFSGDADSTGKDVGIPEIDIQMRSIPIVAKTRKLKAVWTPELAQDLNAYHSVDAEAELTSMLSEYISMEIDLEILDMLRANANAKKEYWSARPAYEYDASLNGGTGGFAATSDNASAYTKGTWFQTLGNKLQAVSNAIHQKTLRGGANWMVVSPETATIIESIPGYAADTAGADSSNKFAMGVQKVGLLNNRWTVYKNPYMLDNTILCGFRGSNFLETGAVYAPYVPLIMTPLVYDPVNFTPRKGVMTRYAKKIVRPEFYGEVVVADVNYV